jgi:hypothetical protein
LEAQNNVGANQWNRFMWNQQKKHKEEVPIWKLRYVVSQGKKITYGQIFKKMVWPIQSIVLFTQ